MRKRIMVDMSATIIHHGHIRLLKKAFEYGDIIVGLTTDQQIINEKGYEPELDYDSRKEILESIKYVLQVVPTSWKINNSILEKYKIDYLVHGDDNSNKIKRDKLLIFPRTDGVSSSELRIKSSDIVNKVKRNILLNPGPATTTDTVKLAQIVPDICPREKEFGLILKEISEDLTLFVADKHNYSTILFGASGTAAIESILSSVLPKKNKIIIVNNGSYGDRMCKIASRYNLNYVEFKSSNISAIDVLKLEETIKTKKNISHIALVHNETTTGLLNDIEKIGTLAKKYKLELILDAMSSYGAIPINMEDLNISYMAASSNKNLQGLPGVSFVIAKNDSLKNLKNVQQLSYYLSLKEQYDYFKANQQTRFTPPVQTLYALKQAIIETKTESIKKRYDRYKKSWRTLIEGINKLGLKHIVDKKNHSKIITAIYLPDHIKFQELHDYFYLRGITIYPGKIDEPNTFRIANIGAINYDDINEFLSLLNSFLILKFK